MSRISIVDCGINNLRSVEKALISLGHQVDVVNTAAQVENASHLILPGVGAFGAAMSALENSGMMDMVLDHAASGKPFLGICLGMQLLFDWSEELGLRQGLGILSGKVVRFPQFPDLKIPHMGWSALQFPHESRLFAGVDAGEMVYFVHSYYVCPDESEVVAATCKHGIEFTAAVERGNLAAVQFHPEKSSRVGLKILDNFAKF
jgi:glutamine amidotransferase